MLVVIYQQITKYFLISFLLTNLFYIILFKPDPPRIQNYSNLQTDDRCDIDLVIEVFPLPRCLIVYEV